MLLDGLAHEHAVEGALGQRIDLRDLFGQAVVIRDRSPFGDPIVALVVVRSAMELFALGTIQDVQLARSVRISELDECPVGAGRARAADVENAVEGVERRDPPHPTPMQVVIEAGASQYVLGTALQLIDRVGALHLPAGDPETPTPRTSTVDRAPQLGLISLLDQGHLAPDPAPAKCEGRTVAGPPNEPYEGGHDRPPAWRPASRPM